MPRIYKKHSSSVRSKVALEAIKEQKTVVQLCQEFSVASSQVFAWKKQLEESVATLFEKNATEEPTRGNRQTS